MMTADARLDDRLPPHDDRAERSLLGAILRDHALLADAAQEVAADDFYKFGHQTIWRAFSVVSERGTPIDLVVLYDHLHAAGHSQDVGGPAYLVDLWESAAAAPNAVHYARIIRKKAKLRRIIHAAGEMQRQAWDAGAEADVIVGQASEIIFGLTDGCGAKTIDWAAAIHESLAVIDRRSGKAAGGELDEGLKTGWSTLDRLTGGLHRKELVILAARPSVGKTLAAINIIDAIASEGGQVFFASLEQGATEIVHRMLSKRSGLNSYKFRTGGFSDFDGTALMNAVDAVRGHRVWINDGAGQPLTQVVAESRRLKMRFGLDMVVVDYLGLMDAEMRRHGTRSEEIGRMTRGLKRIAKDLDVVVLCLAQLNRGSENRPGGRPRLSDLRDSGEIEQDADTVFMLHKPEEKDAGREVDQLDWLVEKQRNGPCGEVAMLHHRRTFEIREAAV